MLSFEMISVAIMLTIFTLSTSKSQHEQGEPESNCITSPDMCTVGERCTFRGADIINGVNVPRYSCMAPCGLGYRRDGAGDCKDIDECEGEPCTGENEACTNSPGGYSCDCADKYRGLLDGACVYNTCNNFPDVCEDTQDCVGFAGFFTCMTKCNDGYERKGPSCVDIDECLGDPCSGDNEACSNSLGSYSCGCMEGYEIGAGGACQSPVIGTLDSENWVCPGNCWTRACSYCSSATTCALSYDLENNPITIRSKGVTVKKYLKMAMYNKAGSKMGTLSFNSRGVFLWGCIYCRQLLYRPKITADPQVWVVEKSGNFLTIYCDGVIIFVNEFNGRCAALYGGAVTKVAFQKTVFAEVLSIPSMIPDADFNNC